MTLTKEQLDRIIATANQNISNGVIQEPRVFFDEILVPNDGTIQYGSADAFRNGEEYPIQIRWMTLGLRYTDTLDSGPTDERLIQRIALRFNFHGQDYMRNEFVLAPLWHDKPVAGGTILTNGQSTWNFDRPFILSSRDAMRVQVQLDLAPGASPPATRTMTVGFTGFGLHSRAPYFRAGDLVLSDTLVGTLDPAAFRNDGDEPIVMTTMTVYVSAEDLSQDPTGDIRIGRVSVQQVGNGTQAQWIQGPSVAPGGVGPGSELCPAVLLGSESGRALVHRWPPDVDSPDGGIYWEPGEGIQLQIQAADEIFEDSNLVLQVALLGSIIVS